MRHVQRHPVRNTIIGVTIAVLTVSSVGAWNVLRPLPAVAVKQSQIAPVLSEAVALAWPASGSAALEAQGITGILTNGEQKALPTASIAKVITALTVLQQKPLELNDSGPTITLTQADVDIYNNYVAADGSVVRVAPGEQITEYQALQAIMLPSANNIADSLAIWAFGSLDAYRTAAAQYTKQIGMQNTTIGPDASGLSPLTASTPTDLIRLGEQAMAHPVLAQIVAQKTAVLPVEGAVYNVNSTLGQSGIVGIKTGNIDEVGGNLLFASKTDVGGKTITIIGAVMGQPDLAAALRVSPPLSASAIASLYEAVPVKAGDKIASYSTKWGATATAVAKKDISFVAWKGANITPEVAMQKAGTSYEKGATVGTISAKSGSSSGTSDVVMSGTLQEPSFWWRLTRH